VTGRSRTPAQAALDDLAAELDPREFATILVTGPGRRPCLTVASRHTHAAEDIYADRLSYWWAWSRRISATDDPLTAARQVTDLLRAAPPPDAMADGT